MAHIKKYYDSWRDATQGRGRGDGRHGQYVLSHKHAARYLAGLLVVVFALVTAPTGTAQDNTPDRLWKLYPLKVPDRQEPSAPPAQQQQQPAGVTPSQTRSGGDRPDTDPSTESRAQFVVTVAGLGLLAVGLVLLLVYSVGLPIPRRPTKRHPGTEPPRGVVLAASFNKGTRSTASVSAAGENKQGDLQKGATKPAATLSRNAQEADGESLPEHQEENEISTLARPDVQDAVEEPEEATLARESEHVPEEVEAEMNGEQTEPTQGASEDAASRIANAEEGACESIESYAKAVTDSTRRGAGETLRILGEYAQEASSTVEAESEKSYLVLDNRCAEAKAAVIETVEQALAVLEDADRTLAERTSDEMNIAARSNSARSRSEQALLSIDSHAARGRALIGADGQEALVTIRAHASEMHALTDSRLERTAASIEAARERALAAIHADSARALVAARTEGSFPDEDQVAQSESAATTSVEQQIRTQVEVATGIIDAYAEEALSAIATAVEGACASIQAETDRAYAAIRGTTEDTAQSVDVLVEEIREAVESDASVVVSQLGRLRVERARVLMEEEITRTRAVMEDELERTIASIQAMVEERLAAMSTQVAPISLSDDQSVPFQYGERPVRGSEAELIEDLTVAAIREAADATSESFRAEAGRAIELFTAEIPAGPSDGMSEPTGTSASGGGGPSDKEGGSSGQSGRKRRRHGRPR
jgi:hypothetical protein